MFPSPDGRANWFVPAPPGDTWSKVLKSSRQKYVWEYTESRAKLYTLLGALIFVSIGICLFPVWPMWMKRGLHYILVTLLAVAIVFLIIRGLIFGAVWFFGYEFWILPNILSEDDELFKPLITFKKAKGVKAWHRAVAVALVAMVAYWIITQPSDFDRLVMAQKQFVSDLYSGALLGDATQADKDRMRAEGVDLDAEVDPTPTAEAEPVAADRFSGSVHSDYDHLDFEPDVPLDDEA